MCIELPNFRSKDTRSNFYLPPKATEALKACIRNRFDIEMWNALHRFDAIFQRQDNLIYAFMEKHGIEQTEKNWNAIAKRYQRKRDIYKRIPVGKKLQSGGVLVPAAVFLRLALAGRLVEERYRGNIRKARRKKSSQK